MLTAWMAITRNAYTTVLRGAVRRRFGGAIVSFTCAPLRGGLESEFVAWVRASVRRSDGRPKRFSFIAKLLGPGLLREAQIYRALAGSRLSLAPRLLGVEASGEHSHFLLLERAREQAAWPWRDTDTTIAVLKQLARLHREQTLRRAFGADGWDYEHQLLLAAQRAVAALEAPPFAGDSAWGSARCGLRRLVGGIGRFRRDLLGSGRFPSGPVHGDVHTGNVVLVGRGSGGRVVLLDWSRARIGSPLEDVSSWTESLGLWEPEARRRHDTLIQGYLSAHGQAGQLDGELRAYYWLAAASNVLAGALEYHLRLIASTDTEPARLQQARHGTRAALRVVTQAAAYWC
jgi:hypothetical protein